MSNGKNTVKKCLPQESKTDTSIERQSSVIFASSTPIGPNATEAWLTLLRADFPAKHSARQPTVTGRRKACGLQCLKLSASYAPGLFSPRMLAKMQSSKPNLNLKRLAILQHGLPLARQTWVQTIYGSAFGYLPTPTTKANWAAGSMQKWPSSRLAVAVFGRPTPEIHEWLMGVPIGWTDLRRLETCSFRLWREQHGGY